MAVTFSPEVLTKARDAGFQDHEIQAVLSGDERIKKALDSGFTLDEVAAVWPKPEPQPLSDIVARIPAGIAKASADALVGISRATAAVEPYLPIVGNLQRALGQGDYREKQQKAQEEMAQLGESAASAYGVKEEYNQTLPSKIASAAGSVVPALASGPLAPVTIAGMMGEQQRQEAEAAGGTEKQKNIAFATGAGLGALSEALMGVPALLRSAKAVGIGAETFKDMAKDAAKQAIKAAAREGVQEGVEQIGQNIIAAKIAGYDPNRKVMAGVKEAAIIGAIVGAPVGAAVQVAETADQVRVNTQVVTNEVNQTLAEVAQAEPPTFTKLSDIPPSAEIPAASTPVPATTAEVQRQGAQPIEGGEPNATQERVQPESDQLQYQGADALRQEAKTGNRNRDARSGEIPNEAQVNAFTRFRKRVGAVNKLIGDVFGDKVGFSNKTGESQPGAEITVVPVEDNPNYAVFENLNVPPSERGRGVASRKLKEVLDAANKEDVSLIFDVDSASASSGSVRGLSDEQLKQWYEREGVFFPEDSMRGIKYSDAELNRIRNETTTYDPKRHKAPSADELFSDTETLVSVFNENPSNFNNGDVLAADTGGAFEVKGGKLVPIRDIKFEYNMDTGKVDPVKKPDPVSKATAEPTTARAETAPTPPPANTPTEGVPVEGVGPASVQPTENLSAAQLNDRIDILLSKHQAEIDPAKRSQIFDEAKGLMAQLKAAEEQSMGPGAAAATETLAQYAERKFGTRFEEDSNLAPELKQTTGNRFYEVLPNKVTAQEASDIIDRVGDDAAERLIRDETNDTSFATRSTVGQILIRKLNQQYSQLKETNPQEAERVLNRAADLAEWQMDYGTRLGQGVQTFAMWMQLSSEGKLLTIKKAVRKARERHRQKNETEVDEILDTLKSDLSKEQKVKAINRLGRTNTTARKVRKKAEQLADKPQTVETFYDIAGKELGLPELSGEQELKLRELGSAVDAAEDGLPKWKAARDFMQYADQIKGFTPTDSALFYFYGNILSGFGTQAVNTVDTLLNVMHEVNTLAVANPQAAAKIYEGMVRGLDTGRADAVLAFTKGRRISSGQIGEAHGFGESAFGTKGGVAINETGPVSKALKKVLESKPAKVFRLWKYFGRGMSASDAVLFRSAQEARAGLLAYRIATEEGLTSSQRAKRVNEILGWDRFDDFLAKAKAEGFQGQEAAARATELMIQQRPEGLNTDASAFAASSTYNDKPKGAFGYAARTAAAIGQKWPAFRLVVPFTNIVANVFNRRLDNLPGVALYRAKRGYYESPEEAKNAIIRANVSLGLLLGVIGAAAAGKIEITGSGPDDPERKKQLKETGWRPYSIKIGNQYWSYANTPISLGLGIVGNMMDWQRYKPTTKKDDDNFAESAVYAVSSIFSYLLSQNFISGLSNFFNILSGSEGERKFALKRFLGSNAAAAAPLSGALKDIDSAFDDTMRVNKHLDEAIIAQIPFVRFMGKPALNAFGEPVTIGRIRPLTRFVNQERTDPAWKVIADKGLRVPVPDPFFKTDEENYQYQKESGQLTKQWVLDNEDRLRAMATPDAQEYMNESTQRIRKGIRGRMIMESIK